MTSEQTQNQAGKNQSVADGAEGLPAGSGDGALERWKLISYLYRGGLAGGVLLIGVVVFLGLRSMKPKADENSHSVVPMVVETVVAKARLVDRPWLGYGTARAMDSADVASEVSGRVIERDSSIEAGEPVEPGQVLLRLDPHDFVQRVSRAQEVVSQLEAELEGLASEEERLIEQVGLASDEVEIAQRDYERTLEADEQGAGSPGGTDAKLRAQRVAARVHAALRGQLDQIPSRRASLHARLAGEQANLRVVQRELDHTVITAPVGGVLQSVDAEVGEWVSAGQTVARVVDLSKIEIPLRVPVSAAGSISMGNEARIESSGQVLMNWGGAVRRMAPEADESSRTMTLFIEVEQSGRVGSGGVMLRPGQFVMGRVIAPDRVPRLLVPRRAIVDDRVFVARADGEAGEGLARVVAVGVEVLYSLRKQYPGLSPDDTEWAVVSVGGLLRDGDEVISSNLDQLRSGMLVDPRDVVKSGMVENTVDLGEN